jgi:hypothetical protein
MLVLEIACAGCGKTGSAGGSSADGVGCGVAAGYELAAYTFDDGHYWFATTDSTPGAVATSNVFPYDATERCGAADSGTTEADVFFASGNRDWGALFGNYAVPAVQPSGEGWEGLAFWGRTHGVTDAGAAFESDREIVFEVTEIVSADQGYTCASDPDAATGVIIDYVTGLPVGTVDAALPCIDVFSRQLTVTEDWRFYLVPWLSLTQNASGRLHSGVAGPSITGLDFRAPPGAHIEFWLDDLAFYRTKPAP